jgi:hypothetical protein
MSGFRVRPGHSFRLFSKGDSMRGKPERRRGERDNDAHANHRAFWHCRCVGGRNANQQRPISVFISMVCDLTRRRERLRWCHVLLLRELGTVQDVDVWHRWKLRPEPILPCAADTTPFGGEATASSARLNNCSGSRSAGEAETRRPESRRARPPIRLRAKVTMRQ